MPTKHAFDPGDHECYMLMREELGKIGPMIWPLIRDTQPLLDGRMRASFRILIAATNTLSAKASEIQSGSVTEGKQVAAMIQDLKEVQVLIRMLTKYGIDLVAEHEFADLCEQCRESVRAIAQCIDRAEQRLIQSSQA